jgi:hypothetical protein
MNLNLSRTLKVSKHSFERRSEYYILLCRIGSSYILQWMSESFFSFTMMRTCYISMRWWWWCRLCTDQGGFNSACSLKQHSAVRHFTALGLMYSDSEQTSLCQFGLTWPRLEPTIYFSRGEYASQCGWCGFFLMDVRLNGNHNCNNKVVCLVWRNCDSMSIPNMWGFPCLFTCCCFFSFFLHV